GVGAVSGPLGQGLGGGRRYSRPRDHRGRPHRRRNASLPAGGTMTLTTTFVGDHEGATALDTSAGSTPADTPTTVNATHWACRVTSLESSVLAAEFGPQAIGTIGAPQAVTLVNRWTSALNVQRLRVGGTASTDFITVGDACTRLSLAVGA